MLDKVHNMENERRNKQVSFEKQRLTLKQRLKKILNSQSELQKQPSIEEDTSNLEDNHSTLEEDNDIEKVIEEKDKIEKAKTWHPPI